MKFVANQGCRATWRSSKRTAWLRGLAQALSLGGTVAVALAGQSGRAQELGRPEFSPPDVSAPVAGENVWGGDGPAYLTNLPAKQTNFEKNYEAKLFSAAEVREIVREELSVAEQMKAAEQEGHVVGSDLHMHAEWHNGLEVSTKAKDFRIHIGGRTQFDAGWYDVDPSLYTAGGAPTGTLGNVYGDGVDFRRARLRVDGTMYEVIEFACEYDFVNGARVRNAADTGTFDLAATAPTDLWIQVKSLPIVGNLRVGNHKEAIGFEHLVSSRFQPFMERSFNQDTFYGGAFNGFTPGISIFNTIGEDELGTWNIGLFKPGNSVFAFNSFDGDYAITARTTRLLRYENDGRSLVHVGVSGRQASTVGDQITFRTRHSLRTGLATVWPTPANTGPVFGDDMQWLNSEFAAVIGPWTVQAEYLVSGLQDARTTAAGPVVGNLLYHGGYFQLFRYLTGENDNYNKKTGAFDRVVPYENFFFVRDETGCGCRGRGAWQVGARYNYLDLNNLGINGGILHDCSASVNWFLNPNAKVQFNYVATYRDAPLAPGVGDGWIHGWGTRVAFDF